MSSPRSANPSWRLNRARGSPAMARSAVRALLGVPIDGSTFSQRWLIVDMLCTRDRFRHTRVDCDSARRR